MISSYGPRAAHYAHRLGDLDAIVTDPEFIGEAYLDAVRRREAGATFYGMVLIDDPRVGYGYRHGAEILAQVGDFDKRRLFIDQFAAGFLPINGRRADEQWQPDPMFEKVAIEFYALCDAMLVRSFTEYSRLADMFARGIIRRPMRPVERILAHAAVPVVARRRPERPGVVVWAPQRAAAELAIVLHGLTEFHGDVTCVSAGGPPPVTSASTATYLQPGDARVEEALAVAAAVVCAEPGDPSDAVAFARLGYGVVAPITSGAHEFAGDIVPWDALNARFLFTSTAVAVARPASVHAEPPRPPRAPVRPPRPAFVTDLPLVSVITPTYNRREDLRKMLSCLASQTYPNIESIVLNDAGEPIDDIVAEFPFARLINLEQNGGAAKACLIGRDHARGEFIALLPDDDWFYPDHFDRLMNAIFRSGCDVAHGTALLRFLERESNGAWRTWGFNATTFSETIAPADTLITSAIGGHQALIRRSVYDKVGWYLPDSDVADNEIQARICKHYFYAFVDHVTAEFRDHAGGTGRNLNFVNALRQMYDELHPVPDRPMIREIRESTLASVARRVPGQSPFPPSLVLHKRPN